MSQLVAVQQKVATVRALLERAKGQIAMALPNHMDADRMLRIAMTSVQRVPKLLDCDPVSLVGAVIQSSQLGLEPDGVMGHAYLIPYGKVVQFQPGYKGLLALARRSGEISSVEARIVYEKDHFEYAFGLKPDLVHIPSRDAEPDEAAFVYAVVRLKDGSVQWDVMSRAQIEAHRRRYSKAAGDDTPWKTAWEEMAKKTVLKRVLKLSPASVELQRAIALDEHADAGLSQDLTAVALAEVPEVAEATRAPSKLDALADTLEGQAVVPEPVAENVAPPEAPDSADPRPELLKAIVDTVATWTTPPNSEAWTAICVGAVGTADLDQVDAAALHDFHAVLKAAGAGDKAARAKVNAWATGRAPKA